MPPDLSGAYLRGHTLDGADLSGVNLERARLRGASLRKANLSGANLKGAYLRLAKLQEANLSWADLTDATLDEANLQKANLTWTHLEAAKFSKAALEGADLSKAFLGDTTSLGGAFLGDEKVGFAYLADVHWKDASLAMVDWSLVKMLGEEQDARQKKTADGKKKDKHQRLQAYQRAVRANRQLAVVLREQGLNEEADHFAYRAQVLQRTVFRLQIRKYKGFLVGRQPRRTFRWRAQMLFSWFFSWILYLLAGYGYRPLRSLICYLVIIFGFAFAYFWFGHLTFFPDTLVLSLISFHGRGFFPGLSDEMNLHNSLVVLAAIEAVVGLFMEITIIVTFTGRFFRR